MKNSRISRLKDKLETLSLAKYKRIEKYILNIESKSELKNEKDKEIVKEINSLIYDRINRIKNVGITEAVLYILIYFSLFSFFFKDILYFSKLATVLGAIISFFGTSVFLIALFFATRLKNLYYQDLNLLTAHIVSIYTKNRFTEDSLFEDSNAYKSYISFFKKRGF